MWFTTWFAYIVLRRELVFVVVPLCWRMGYAFHGLNPYMKNISVTNPALDNLPTKTNQCLLLHHFLFTITWIEYANIFEERKDWDTISIKHRKILHPQNYRRYTKHKQNSCAITSKKSIRICKFRICMQYKHPNKMNEISSISNYLISSSQLIFFNKLMHKWARPANYRVSEAMRV